MTAYDYPMTTPTPLDTLATDIADATSLYYLGGVLHRAQAAAKSAGVSLDDLIPAGTLPTYGGDTPASTVGLWSWDVTHVLVRDSVGFALVARPPVNYMTACRFAHKLPFRARVEYADDAEYCAKTSDDARRTLESRGMCFRDDGEGYVVDTIPTEKLSWISEFDGEGA